ncbi:MAG: hypothetical protein INQ03_04960 [Candidatus Heimdallarchaeota archaeon]|nr:hypothetical protein [Candidatus Heimdallarchaeota archaeon]
MLSFTELDPAWYIGFFGNLLVIVIITASIILSRKHNPQINWSMYIPLLTLATIFISIVILYFSQFLVQIDWNEEQSAIPMIMATLNSLFVVVLFDNTLYRIGMNLHKRLVPVLISSGLLIYSLLSMYDYQVLWRDGAILVYYVNKSAETLNVNLTVIILAASIFLALNKMIELKDGQPDDDEIIHYHMLVLHIAALVGIFSAFLIPRTDPDSITNPVNVKIFAYFSFYLFIGFYSLSLGNSKRISDLLAGKNRYLLEPSLELSERQERGIYFALFSHLLVIVSLVILISNSNVNIDLVADDEVGRGMAIFLLEQGGIKWYMHVIGAMLPLVFAGVLLVISLKYSRNRSHFIKHTLLLLGVIFIITAANMRVFKLYRVVGSAVIPSTFHYYLIPLIFLLFTAFIKEETWAGLSNQPNGKEILLGEISPFIIYIVTVFGSIFLDFLIPYSSTGKIMIGGASWLDGIVIIPILSALIYQLMIILWIFMKMKPGRN